MPVYKRGREWRVVVWYRNQRHDFICAGTKGEAEEFEARKRVELMSADPRAEFRSVPTFSDFSLGAYKAHAETHLKTRTWSNRVYTIATLIESFGDLRLHEFTTGAVDAYKNARINQEIRASTINDELKVLRAILGYARELGIPVTDLQAKDLPTRGVKRKVTFWTTEQVAKLLAATADKSKALSPLVMFLLNTGCRKGEALALEWSHVDLKRNLILIQPGEEWQPKDGKAREIPISSALLPWLQHGSSKRWVFPNRKHQRYVTWPQRAFDRARSHAKLSGGPHTCRHTFASHFLANCPDLFLLAKLLGHSHGRVTELYAHLLPDHLARARDVVNFGALPVLLAAKA